MVKVTNKDQLIKASLMRTLMRSSESQRKSQLINQKGIKMNNKKLYSLIKDRFDYRDGKLFYRHDLPTKMKAGDEAGCYSSPYCYITIERKQYLLHRIIYLWNHGNLPKMIDHINNDPSDNRIENLRAANFSQNNHNRTINKNSSSGVKGVYLHKPSQKYLARIKKNNAYVYIEYFDNLEEARNAIYIARERIHGQFANHG